jgi:hypothetical protein
MESLESLSRLEKSKTFSPSQESEGVVKSLPSVEKSKVIDLYSKLVELLEKSNLHPPRRTKEL